MKAGTSASRLVQRAAPPALLFVLLSVIFVAAPAVCRAEAVWADSVLSLEAEWFDASFNEGGQAISASTDTSCGNGSSGGGFVGGLDYPGDWIQMMVQFPDPIVFRDSLRTAGDDIGVRHKFVIQFIGVNGQGLAFSDTLTTPPGRGIT